MPMAAVGLMGQCKTTETGKERNNSLSPSPSSQSSPRVHYLLHLTGSKRTKDKLNFQHLGHRMTRVQNHRFGTGPQKLYSQHNTYDHLKVFPNLEFLTLHHKLDLRVLITSQKFGRKQTGQGNPTQLCQLFPNYSFSGKQWV